MSATPASAGRIGAAAAGGVLITLAASQFLMTLDSSVMNVSIGTVAKDVGSNVTGIQTAITLYTLVMASLMITGGRLGQVLGRKRAFSLGCVIYGTGSLVTALAHSLVVLILGWSFLEGVGAALILPGIVALVASNFAPAERPRAYGLVAAAGAIAVAAGPLIGGLFTTYLSWRYVFVGEVLIVLVILALIRRLEETPSDQSSPMDVVGTVLSALSVALIVLGVLRAGAWGLISPKSGAPEWLGLSVSIWLIFAGGLTLVAFLAWETHLVDHGREPLVKPAILRNVTLRGGLIAFFFQYLLQAGTFFVVPLFLSVSLGLSAIQTGLRVMPLSIALLVAALGIPKLFPSASPRLIVRVGFGAVFAGILILIGALQAGAGAAIVTGPLLLVGLGIGSLASQLGSITVSAVPDSESAQVGGLQNTVTNLGASIGTALAGAVLVSALTLTLSTGIQHNAQIPASFKKQASVQLSGGVPFMSDASLKAGLQKAHVAPAVADQVVSENSTARITGLRTALSVLALIAVLAMLMTFRIPDVQPASSAGKT